MLDKESKRLMTILEALDDGIYVVRDDYTVEFMNQAMIRDFGEGVGRKCYEVITGKNEICGWCRAEEVLRGAKVHGEVYLRSVDKAYDILEMRLENADGTTSKRSEPPTPKKHALFRLY